MTDDTSKKKIDESGGKIQLPLLPLRGMVVFPHAIASLMVGREKSIKALQHCASRRVEILVAPQIQSELDELSIDDLYPVGTISTLLQFGKVRTEEGTADEAFNVLLTGQKRARIVDCFKSKNFLTVEIEELEETMGDEVEVAALVRMITHDFGEYIRLKKLPPEMLGQVSKIENVSKFSDTVANFLGELSFEDKNRQLLEANLHVRLLDLYASMQDILKEISM